MTHQQKLAIMFRDLGDRGVKAGAMASWLYRIFWKLGVPITPPHFASFAANALLMGAWFTAFMLFVWFILFRHRDLPLNRACMGAVWSGIFLGFMWGAYYRWQARKLSLPKWRDYPAKTI